MKLCCHTMQSIELDCRCSEQRSPDSFTVEEIRKYITGTHNERTAR